MKNYLNQCIVLNLELLEYFPLDTFINIVMISDKFCSDKIV